MKVASREPVVNTVLIRQREQLGRMDKRYCLYRESSFLIKFKACSHIILVLRRTLQLISASQFTLGDTTAPQRIKCWQVGRRAWSNTQVFRLVFHSLLLPLFAPC